MVVGSGMGTRVATAITTALISRDVGLSELSLCSVDAGGYCIQT